MSFKKAMAAHRPTDSRRSEGDAYTEHQLPELECDACGETWSESEVWYPSLSLAKSADAARFSENHTVSLRELQLMRKELLGVGKRELRLPPGSGIGLVRGKIPKQATDFVWCGFRLLVRSPVVKTMSKQGIILPCGPASLRMGSTATDAYLAIELDPVPLYAKETLQEITMVFCGKCGSTRLENVRANCDGLTRYVHRRMPKGHGLVRVYESWATLASEAFIAAVRQHGFSGIEFKEDGIFV